MYVYAVTMNESKKVHHTTLLVEQYTYGVFFSGFFATISDQHWLNFNDIPGVQNELSLH